MVPNTHFKIRWTYNATLRDTVDLPSARGTRQMPKNTRQTICRVLHSAYSTRHWFVGKQLFAECFLSHTRQMVCRVSNLTLGKKKKVCRAFFQNTLGKGLLFAECFFNYTRQTYFPKKKNNCIRTPLKPLRIHTMSDSSPNVLYIRKMHDVDSTIK